MKRKKREKMELNENNELVVEKKDMLTEAELVEQFKKEIDKVQQKFGLALVAQLEHRMYGEMLQFEPVMKIARLR